jgi:signal transduction histidine kinase
VRTAAEAAPGGWSAWVRDTGVGLAEASVHGTGLRNVRETLTAFFGPRARLSVEQPDGGGVIARIDVAAVSTPAPVAAVPAPGRTG